MSLSSEYGYHRHSDRQPRPLHRQESEVEATIYSELGRMKRVYFLTTGQPDLETFTRRFMRRVEDRDDEDVHIVSIEGELGAGKSHIAKWYKQLVEEMKPRLDRVGRVITFEH